MRESGSTFIHLRCPGLMMRFQKEKCFPWTSLTYSANIMQGRQIDKDALAPSPVGHQGLFYLVEVKQFSAGQQEAVQS